MIYFEIDSFLPKTDSFWEFFTDPSKVALFNGREGYRIQSHVVGKNVSQGLIYSLGEFSSVVLTA